MAIVLDGNLGITTPAETVQGALTTTGNTILGDASTDTLNVGNGGLVKDASGNVGIGKTPSGFTGGKLDVAGFGYFNFNATNEYVRVGATSGGTAEIYRNAGDLGYTVETSYNHKWYTGGNERMRIDSSGNLLVGTTSNTDNCKSNIQFSGNATNGVTIKNLASSGDPNLFLLNDSAQTLNNTSNSASYQDSTGQRWILRKNGGLANYSANNVNLSDERTKKDIVNAGSYLDKICAIPVRTFLYKDQTDTQLNLGVIAQEVESVAPELVDVSGFGETPKDGVPLKAIYQTDLQYALMKSIQELKAVVDAQAVRIAALES